MREIATALLIIVSIIFICWALALLNGCATDQPCDPDDEVCIAQYNNQTRDAQAMLQTGTYLTPPPTRF